MAQVILIEDNKTMNDLLSVNLTTYLGVDLIHRTNAQDALSLLAILPSIDLIISKARVANEDTANDINYYLTENKMEIPFVVLGGQLKTKNEHAITIASDKDWEKVISVSAKVLGINEDILAKKAVPDYVPVPVRYFLNIEVVNCDVFIRIKKTATEYQFVKRIHNGDTFSKDSIKHYLDQGLEHFYIAKEFYKSFAILLSNRLVEKIDSPTMDITSKIQLMGESYDIAIREITTLGFNSETVQLTDTIIQNMIKNFEHNPEMSGLLHKVINSKTGLLYQKSHMISVVASEVVKNLKIEDADSHDKLAFAAFFHDITLSENDDLTKINSFEELEKAQLTESAWDMVFNHAHDAALLIKNHPDAPTGADDIIRHHHGAFNGKGFSNNIEKLPNLSKIFVIAHSFVQELFKFKEIGGEPKPITDELYKRYPAPEVAVIIRALEKTLKKKK